MLPGETDGFSSESKARGSNESGGLAFMSVRFEVDRYLNDNYSQLKVKPRTLFVGKVDSAFVNTQ